MKITLCGSTRFEKQFKEWNERLTLVGHVVHSITVYPSDKGGKKEWYTDDQKVAFDRAHKRKIADSDAILVLNVDGYIGESTVSEIAHAQFLSKKVFYTHPMGKVPQMKDTDRVCPYAGCYDPMVNRPPCALCYE